MSLVRKLKPDRSITGLLVPLSMLFIFGMSAFAISPEAAFIILAALTWIHAGFTFYVFLRTRNLPNLVACAYMVFIGYLAYSFPPYLTGNLQEDKGLVIGMFSVIIFFGVVLLYLVLTRKIKWRGREVFELAAEEVAEGSNGYTARPRPVGKVDFSRQQIDTFARFAASHLIALPYISNKNVTLVPVKMGDEYGRLLGLIGDYRDATWVNFDDEGNVSVHISQKDYLDYRESLAFDPLCSAFGQLFIDFLTVHARGEGVRIIDRMDDLKIGVFS